MELWGALWSGAMWSVISEVELCGAPFVRWSCGELHPWSGTMGSSVEWSCGEFHLWSGVIGSSICEVELCGAPSVRWSYGKLYGVELWGAQSVWWSYGELWFWRWLMVVNLTKKSLALQVFCALIGYPSGEWWVGSMEFWWVSYVEFSPSLIC